MTFMQQLKPVNFRHLNIKQGYINLTRPHYFQCLLPVFGGEDRKVAHCLGEHPLQAGQHILCIINDQESIEALKSFMMLRGMLIPRLTIYSALLLGLLVSYVSYYPWRGDFRDLTTLFIGLFSAGAFLFEAVKQYRGLDFMRKE